MSLKLSRSNILHTILHKSLHKIICKILRKIGAAGVHGAVGLATIATPVLLSSSLLIVSPGAVAQEQMLLRFEKSRSSDDLEEPEIASIGVFSISEGMVGNFDLVNFAPQSGTEGEIWGFDFGLGYSLSSRGSPLVLYLGFGIFTGYNSDQSDYITGYYPSAGLVYSIKQGVGLTATAKRYHKVYDDALDTVTIGIVLTY